MGRQGSAAITSLSLIHISTCPHCEKPMKYLAQIQWDTVFDCAEGTLYIEFCPDCQIVSMQHQQT